MKLQISGVRARGICRHVLRTVERECGASARARARRRRGEKFREFGEGRIAPLRPAPEGRYTRTQIVRPAARLLLIALCGLAAVVAASGTANAATTLTTLVSFNNFDGNIPPV
jgi:hypothetical protein